MESAESFDLALLAIYQAKDPEKLQTLVSKYVPLFLQSLSVPGPAFQKKAMSAINDILVFVKGRKELKVPLKETVDVLLNATQILQKNVTVVFVKLALSRCEKAETVSELQRMLDAFEKLTPQLQPLVVTSYVDACSLIDGKTLVGTLSKHQAALKTIDKAALQGLVKFMTDSTMVFAGHEELFIELLLKFEVKVKIPVTLDANVLRDAIVGRWVSMTLSQKNVCLDVIAQIKTGFPIGKILEVKTLPNALRCLDVSLIKSTPKEVEEFAYDLSELLYDQITDNVGLLCFRTLLKKCHHLFSDSLRMFKGIFKNEDLAVEDKHALLMLFASFIEPSQQILSFLEQQIFDGELFGLALLREIYPFDAPRPRVLACILISDPNYSDECRLLLSPYRHTGSDGFRVCIYDPKAKPPTTADFLGDIVGDKRILNYLLEARNSKVISTIFDFACVCEPKYPIPYDFVIDAMAQSPASAIEISKFLVFLSRNLPRDENFKAQRFVEYLGKESDPTIIESLAQFLEWTGAEFNAEETAEKLKGPQRLAFLAHFGFPFDECMAMLSTSGQASLGKSCLMALAKRKKLDETHFEKLFPLLSSDATGIEILAVIAENDEQLCQKLATRLFEPPLVTTDRVEIVVSAARQLCETVNEEKLVSLIENGIKAEKSRRNSAIFLVYLVNHHEPERLWFTARTLLYCCGAENGLVRTAGLLGMNILYRRSQNKDKIEAAIMGKERPEGEDAQVLTGQPRAQVVLNLLKIAQRVETFAELVLALIEPEFLIFNGIDVPKPKIEGTPFAAKFYYFSFSPNEDVSASFRRLWRWATDGGKKMSIPEIIAVIDPEQDSWESQQMNLNCMYDVVQRMTSEQMQEYLIQLTKLAMKMVYSPVQKLSIAGVGLLEQMVTKCGRQINQEVQSFILNLSAELFDSRQVHLVALATKWGNQFIQMASRIEDGLGIYHSMFKGLSTILAVPKMLPSETWAGFTKAVFKCADLDLAVFFDEILKMMSTTYVLETQRYAIYYSFDTVVRSPKRVLIADRVSDLLPKLFDAVTNEKAEIVASLMISVVQHSIACVHHGMDDIYPYDDFLLRLYFEDNRADIVATLLKQICTQSPECLRSSITPLILFASCAEQNSKEFSIILRDEIPIRIEINSGPEQFVDFAMKYGVNNEKLAFRPTGCKTLLQVVENMRDEVKLKFLGLIDTICAMLDGRLWPFKECLIDVIRCLVPVLENVSDSLLAMIEKQTMRQKSVFRAAAFRCLLEIHKKRDINIDSLISAMMDAMNNGTVVAQHAAAECASLIIDRPQYQEFIELAYAKLNQAKDEDLPEFARLILDLPEHEIPHGFDPTPFLQKAKNLPIELQSVSQLVSKLNK